MATKDLVDAVIVAAGQSLRYGSNKLLEDLCGRPVIVRTIDAIAKAPSIAQIIIVVAPDQLEQMKTTCIDTATTKKKLFVCFSFPPGNVFEKLNSRSRVTYLT